MRNLLPSWSWRKGNAKKWGWKFWWYRQINRNKVSPIKDVLWRCLRLPTVNMISPTEYYKIDGLLEVQSWKNPFPISDDFTKLNRFNLITHKELKNRNRNDYKSTQEPYLQLTRYTLQSKHSNLSKKETEEPLSLLKTIWIPYNLHHLT